MIRLLRSTKAQALVEFALILPLFLLLLFGIIEFSRIGYSYVTLNNAVRSGARTASLGALDLPVQQTIVNASPYFDPDLLTIEITPAEADRHSGSTVTVSASYPVRLNTPLISQVLPNPVIVKTTLSMRIE